jgi:integrase
MLRHACGSALANKGHDTRVLQAYLGHRNIQHTVRYTDELKALVENAPEAYRAGLDCDNVIECLAIQASERAKR